MRIWGNGMGKRILIGSMLVLAMLLLMPSIPAVQQKTIEEGYKQDIQEKLESITLDELEDIEVLDGIKRPLLRALVLSFFNFQGLRFVFYFVLALVVFAEPVDDGEPGLIQPTHPILFSICLGRALLLLLAGTIWAEFWNHISDTLGWGWDIPLPP